MAAQTWDSAAKWMQRATASVMRLTLSSTSTRSTSSVVNRFTTFATQKNIPLMITEGMPEASSSISPSETNELNPARSTTTSAIIRQTFSRKGSELEADSRKAEMNPSRFRIPMTFRLERRQVLWMKVPRLLKKAVERLAARPSSAIYFSLSPCPSKITRNSEPYVQFTPTMLPQQTRVVIVHLCCFQNLETLETNPSSGLVLSLGVDSGALILSLSLQRRASVKMAEAEPTRAMMQLRSLILLCTSAVGTVSPSPPVMQLIPQRIQKFNPKTGRKSGMDAAQPFW